MEFKLVEITIEQREELFNFWNITSAVIQRQWKCSTPLRRFLMLNTHPLWKNRILAEWMQITVDQKEFLLTTFWDVQVADVLVRMDMYKLKKTSKALIQYPQLWEKRPDLWKKLYFALPWQYILLEYPNSQKAKNRKRLEELVIFVLDRLAVNIYIRGIEVELFTAPSIKEIVERIEIDNTKKWNILDFMKVRTNPFYQEVHELRRKMVAPFELYIIKGQAMKHKYKRELMTNFSAKMSELIYKSALEQLMTDILGSRLQFPGGLWIENLRAEV